MDQQTRNRRIVVIKAADAINAIESAPVSDFFHRLSAFWAKRAHRDEIESSLMGYYRKVALETQSRRVQGVTKGFPQGD